MWSVWYQGMGKMQGVERAVGDDVGGQGGRESLPLMFLDCGNSTSKTRSQTVLVYET